MVGCIKFSYYYNTYYKISHGMFVNENFSYNNPIVFRCKDLKCVGIS